MTTALIFGVGRTGGYAAARAAVHGLDVVLVDHDRFELHNFEEHFVRDPRYAGERKALALEDILTQEFRGQAFRGLPQNVYDLPESLWRALIAGSDLVLACTGDPEANKYICSLAGAKPVVVTGVYADDEDLRGFVFASRREGMCLSCWDNREEVAGRRRGDPYNFRQTAASAVDIAMWLGQGFAPPALCLLRRGGEAEPTVFRWIRGERNPDCPLHDGPVRSTTPPAGTQTDRASRRSAPRLPWWSILRLLPIAVMLHAIGQEGRTAVASYATDVVQQVGRLIDWVS